VIAMSCEIIQFSTAPRSEKIKTSTRVGEDIGDNLPAEITLGRTGRPLPEPLTETCRNQRLRDARKDAWNHARHTTDYWRARMKWHSALSCAQRYGIGDSASFTSADYPERYSFVDMWRAALVKQLLTPAPDVAAVTWKRTQLADGQYEHAGVKRERIEHAIATDAEWLAAHPTKRSIAASRHSSKPEQEE
jgi:hypothetical protein